MRWRPVAEDDRERTEICEISGRGCLVRLMAREPSGWRAVALTWCPQLGAADFGAAAEAPPRAQPAAAPAPAPSAEVAPAAAAVPASSDASPSAAPAEAAPASTPAPAPAPAPAPSDEPVDDVLTLLREYVAVQTAVVAVFRSKMGVSSGQLGFLLDAPKVGSFSAPGHGDWVWRIDTSSVILTSRRRAIELPLPSHSRDDAFDPAVAATFLETSGKTAMSHQGSVLPLDPATLDGVVKKMVREGSVLLFSSQPRPVYLVRG
jgi:hypothetical protein